MDIHDDTHGLPPLFMMLYIVTLLTFIRLNTLYVSFLDLLHTAR